jgi:HD-GYP domain-containing protein (c-di-GMP phosphodiesterase class II)
VTFVCDAYDAMVSDRPYRDALGPQAATTEVRRNAGAQFCPRAAGALLSVLSRPRTPSRAGVRRTTLPPV